MPRRTILAAPLTLLLTHCAPPPDTMVATRAAEVLLLEPTILHIPDVEPAPVIALLEANPPPSALKVTAFVAGMPAHILTRDGVDGPWRGRCVLPPHMAQVPVTVEYLVDLGRGRTLQLLDEVEGSTQTDAFGASLDEDVLWPGDVLAVDVDAVEAAQSVSLMAPALGLAKVLGVPVKAHPARYRVQTLLPSDTAPGEYLLHIQVVAKDGSRFQRSLLLNVVRATQS